MANLTQLTWLSSEYRHRPFPFTSARADGSPGSAEESLCCCYRPPEGLPQARWTNSSPWDDCNMYPRAKSLYPDEITYYSLYFHFHFLLPFLSTRTFFQWFVQKKSPFCSLMDVKHSLRAKISCKILVQELSQQHYNPRRKKRPKRVHSDHMQLMLSTNYTGPRHRIMVWGFFPTSFKVFSGDRKSVV